MSEKGGISLFRLLGRGLWFLLRVIILLLTDTWIGSKDEKPGKKPASAAGTFAPRRAEPNVASLKTTDVVESVERMLRRAERVQALVLQVTAGDGMARWFDDALIGPLRAQLTRAKAGDVRALLELARALPAYEASLAFLARAVEARRNPTRAQLLADVEEVAVALAEPLRELADDGVVRVRQRRFVAVPRASAQELEAVHSAGLVAPIVLTAETASDPRAWPLLAGQVARSLLDDVSGWMDELRGLLGSSLPPRLLLATGATQRQHASDEAWLGPWLRVLMADALATYMLGPSYALALYGQFAADDVQSLSVARAEGRWLSNEPPPRLRLYAALSTLDDLGFEADASALRARLGALADPSNGPGLQIPSLDGSFTTVPFEPLAEAIDAQISLALQEPNLALGQRTWFDVVGLGFLRGEQGEVDAARGRLARGEKVGLPPRVLVAAAAAAMTERGVARETVLGALLRSIRGVDVLEGLAVALPAPPRSDLAKTRLRDLVSDPRAIREAIVLGAVFSPPKARNRALSKR